MSKILITGASGNIGTPLVAELKAQGIDFDVLRSSGAASAGMRVASYDDPAALARAFSGIDTLFVLLPLVPNKIALAENVVGAAKAAGVGHIVRSSGAGADAVSPFALSRLQGTIDGLFNGSGIATTILRPSGFMQNYATHMAEMVRACTVYTATGDGRHSVIDARDIAAVAAKVLADPAAHRGRTYDLSGSEASTEAERLAVLSAALGRTISHAPVSVADARDGMLKAGLPPAVVEWLSSLNEVVSQGFAAGISPDAPRLLGRPSIRFDQFVTDHLAVWQ